MQVTYLMDIGLSNIQARIYITLLTEPNITGYKIAKILNEPVANTYKALEGLIKKGIAVLDESGNNKLYSVFPITAYLNQLEATFKNKRKAIEEEFKKIKPAKLKDGIFKIDNIQQLYEIAGELIKNSKGVLAVDSTSLPLEIFKPYLEGISKKGVSVIIKSYSKISIPNCETICFEDMGVTALKEPIQFFNISNPGYEYASALLNGDNTEIIEAIDSNSKYLSFMAYSGIVSELALTKLLAAINQGKNSKELLKIWAALDYIRPSNVESTQDYFRSI